MFPFQSINNTIVPAKKSYTITACTQYTAPTIPLDDTIPQLSEGVDIGFSGSITIRNASSKISGRVNIFGAPSTNLVFLTIAVFRGSNNDAVGSCIIRDTSELHTYVLDFEDSPGAAGTYIYTVRIGVSSGNFTVNGVTGTRFLGGSAETTLTLEEILP